MNAEDNDYERGIKRLIKMVQHVCEAEKEWSPTPLKKDIEKIAATLEETARLLERDGCAQFDIEFLHDERDIPVRAIDLNGWPVENKTIIERPSYKAVTWYIRGLAESARVAADQLPNPREKRALKYAARGLLHLMHHCGRPCPSLYDNGAGVQEFKQICECAGMNLSVESYRGALAASLKNFDPYYTEQHYDELFQ